jgi:hypothetical protein
MGKIKNNHRFGTTPNSLLNNNKISLKAKGLYAYMDSKPENWDFTIKGIVSQIKESYDAVSSALFELCEAGYLTRVNYQNELGRWDCEYTLYPLGDGIIEPTAGLLTVQGKHRDGEIHLRKTPVHSNKEEVKKNKVRKSSSTPPPTSTFTSDIDSTDEVLSLLQANELLAGCAYLYLIHKAVMFRPDPVGYVKYVLANKVGDKLLELRGWKSYYYDDYVVEKEKTRLGVSDKLTEQELEELDEYIKKLKE